MLHRKIKTRKVTKTPTSRTVTKTKTISRKKAQRKYGPGAGAGTVTTVKTKGRGQRKGSSSKATTLKSGYASYEVKSKYKTGTRKSGAVIKGKGHGALQPASKRKRSYRER